MKNLLLFVLLGLFTCGGNALYEDQVGKWDWRARHIGCPNQVFFSNANDGQDLLLFSTEKNLVAGINPNSGEIAWRQLNEEVYEVAPQTQLHDDGKICYVNSEIFLDFLVIVNGGEFIRVFDVSTGVMKSQKRFGLKSLRSEHVSQLSNTLFVLEGKTLKAFETGESLIWHKDLEASVEWLQVSVVGRSVVVVGKNGHGKLERRWFAIDGKETVVKKSAQEEGFSLNQCVFSTNSLACVNGKGISTIHFSENSASVSSVALQNPSQIKNIGQNFYSVRDSDKVVFVGVCEKGAKALAESPFSPVTTVSGNAKGSPTFAIHYEATKKLKLIVGDETREVDVAADKQAPVRFIRLRNHGDVYELLTVREDCRVDFLEGQKASKPNLEWTRFEALASISSVELVDLPLSDEQATIEEEFEGGSASLIRSFFLRIHGQTEQLRKSFISFANHLINSAEQLTNGRQSIAAAARNLFGLGNPYIRPPRAGSPLQEITLDIPLERDFFNLRKMIVVSTLDGSVYGIHNQYGTVLWAIHLGTQFEPLTNQFGEKKVPLFIQRSTAHYQFQGQGAVVFNLKASKKSRVLLFNPITGAVQDSSTFTQLKRVELLPFQTAQSLHPLLLVDINNQINVLPELSTPIDEVKPVHLFNVDVKLGTISGGNVNTTLKRFDKLFETKLGLKPDEKIRKIQGKPANEKVHSQGKVLGDRSVLYKYANPNLVAILTVDSVHTTITIYLVDAVTGQIVHTARQERASEPAHLLHCENWIAYTYWNEKSRRTEIGVLELYEGLEQTNANHFNSFTTLKHPLNVISKAFVFPQGVSAISATDTELGLTTRSVLIAMPFGGVMEVSRRFLDARRSFEMTPELREEMVVPYIPEIPIATEDLINYNQTVMRIVGLKTAPSGLESTSLLLAYGLDMFYTRLTPSGTFDILKDDFDYILISLVMIGLVVASVVCKRLARYQSLKQAWA